MIIAQRELAKWKAAMEAWLITLSDPQKFETEYRKYEQERREREQEIGVCEVKWSSGAGRLSGTRVRVSKSQDTENPEGHEDDSLLDLLLNSKVETSREEDYALVQVFIHGNGAKREDAMTRLYWSSYRKVWRFSKKILTQEALKANRYRVQPEAVEDVASEAFIRILKKGALEKFNGKSTFSTFVNGFVRNIVMEDQKKTRFDDEKDENGRYQYAKVIRLDHLALTHRETIEKEATEWLLSNCDTDERKNALVRQVWNELPAELWKVLYRKFDRRNSKKHKDLEYEEIAKLMGLKDKNAVDYRIREAKRLMKAGLLAAGFCPKKSQFIVA